MRIAWVAINREHLPDPVVPIGMLQVASTLADRHEPLLLDLCFSHDPLAELSDFLEATGPDLVAFGIRNLVDNDWGPPDATLRYVRDLVAVARGRVDAPVLLGGGGFSVLPGPLLEVSGADYGIAGEGEVAAGLLLDALEAGERDADVPGVWRLVEGHAIPPSRAAPAADLAALPRVDRRLVDPRHHRTTGIESVQTHRGCPLRCAWCTYPDIEGRRARLRPPERVAEEFEHIREAAPEVSHVFVVDAVFNLPIRQARRVCDVLAERNPGLPWTSYANPIAFDEPLAEAMVRAGCRGVEMGVDSGHDEVLVRLRKGFDTRRVREAREAARRAGLMVCPTFLLATPGETLDEVRATLDFAHELEPDAAIFMVYNDAADTLRPPSPERQALREATLALLRSAARAHATWIVPPLRYRFDRRLFATLRRRGLDGPLWQHLPSHAGTAGPRPASSPTVTGPPGIPAPAARS